MAKGTDSVPDAVSASGVGAAPVSDAAALAHVRAVTRNAGSSFYWAMRILPPARREAMFAVYAFCREVDDIADGEASVPEKMDALDAWREEIGRIFRGAPRCATARALVGPARRYDLEEDELLAVVDGMTMDVSGMMRAPPREVLSLYCRRVAGAVGLLSIRAFGAPQKRARDFALALGDALQLTNILRDLRQDAAMGRLYLPRETLAAHGIDSGEPDAVLRHPALPQVCQALAEEARQRYAEAEAALADCPGGALRPAIVMMMSYRRILERLCQAGWRNLDDAVAVSKAEKLWIAFRYGLM